MAKKHRKSFLLSAKLSFSCRHATRIRNEIGGWEGKCENGWTLEITSKKVNKVSHLIQIIKVSKFGNKKKIFPFNFINIRRNPILLFFRINNLNFVVAPPQPEPTHTSTSQSTAIFVPINKLIAFWKLPVWRSFAVTLEYKWVTIDNGISSFIFVSRVAEFDVFGVMIYVCRRYNMSWKRFLFDKSDSVDEERLKSGSSFFSVAFIIHSLFLRLEVFTMV